MTELHGGFDVTDRTAPCIELAGRLPELTQRTLVMAYPTDSAAVLGSTQNFSALQRKHCEQSGYSVVHRKSGGGGVIIVPGEIVWMDLFLPANDPLYIRDIREGSYWIGELWAQSLGKLGLDSRGLSVHRGGMIDSPWSSLCCFAGIGPGEVTYRGQKIMGLSQRRTRAGAWFFSLVYRQFYPERDAYLLATQAQSPAVLADALRDQVTAVEVPQEDIVRAVLGSLDHLG